MTTPAALTSGKDGAWTYDYATSKKPGVRQQFKVVFAPNEPNTLVFSTEGDIESNRYVFTVDGVDDVNAAQWQKSYLVTSGTSCQVIVGIAKVTKATIAQILKAR